MVKISINADCGNAPKKAFLKDFLVATVNSDWEFVTRTLTDDVYWNLIGNRCLKGKQDVLASFAQLRGEKLTELSIDTIITHGYDGSANGILHFQDGGTIAFCDIYHFRASTNNAPINGITTYTITLS
jgi:hypothetical protein